MDDIDLRLCAILMANCRTPYSQLAEALSISAPSVQRRIQSLREQNIIRGFAVRWSISQKGAVPIMLSGSSKAPNDAVIKALATCDRVERAFFSGQGRIYVDGVLRSGSESPAYVAFVKKAAALYSIDSIVQGQDPSVGAREPLELSHLDIRVLVALCQDPRMQVKDLAKTVSISAKTTTKRLDRMIEGRAIEPTMLWAPTFSSGVVSVLEVQLRESADPVHARGEIASAHSSRMMGFALTGKKPETLLCMAWSPTAQSHADLVASLLTSPSVAGVSSDILQTGCYFRSWLYDIPGK